MKQNFKKSALITIVLLLLSIPKSAEAFDFQFLKKYFEENKQIIVNETASGPEGAYVKVEIKNQINTKSGTSTTEINTTKSPAPSGSPTSGSNPSTGESPNSSFSPMPTLTPVNPVVADKPSGSIFKKIWNRIADFWRNFWH